MITINGQDGGGQILRSALALSMITGQGFRMTNIRGKRSKPGLMRQHLTCVKAAIEISSAAVSGAEMHSTELIFNPGKVRAGDYVFRIGSAGSSTLLFQTIMPALIYADGVSEVEIHGGTHNPMAPSADFIERAFLPQIRAMGAPVSFECMRHGFAPAGGGCIRAEVHPVDQLKSLSILERGDLLSQKVESSIANVRADVAEKELKVVKSSLGWPEKCYHIKHCDEADGSGNALFIDEAYSNMTIHITSLGAPKKSAEIVANDAVKAYTTFQKSKAAVGPRLADQLLLPMALAGNSEIATQSLTNHIRTNIKLIEKFLVRRFLVDDSESGRVLISVE